MSKGLVKNRFCVVGPAEFFYRPWYVFI